MFITQFRHIQEAEEVEGSRFSLRLQAAFKAHSSEDLSRSSQQAARSSSNPAFNSESRLFGPRETFSSIQIIEEEDQGSRTRRTRSTPSSNSSQIQHSIQKQGADPLNQRCKASTSSSRRSKTPNFFEDSKNS